MTMTKSVVVGALILAGGCGNPPNPPTWDVVELVTTCGGTPAECKEIRRVVEKGLPDRLTCETVAGRLKRQAPIATTEGSLMTFEMVCAKTGGAK